MRFQFATAGNILFGPGTLSEVPPYAAGRGKRCFVVTGRTDERAAPLLNLLERHHTTWTTFHVEKEPTVKLILSAVGEARGRRCDVVIGMGGGSALDVAKAVAALLTNTGELMDYLEVVGKGRSLDRSPAPLIALPTTAGTGAEVTCNAVIGVPERGVKVSMRSPLMLPELAVVDPLLTASMPPSVTAATGMDALTQLLEAYVSIGATPMTDGFCREGLKRAAGSLEAAYQNGRHGEAREGMALASLLGGLALANAKLGAVHGIAGPMGGMLPAPHGAICARLLPLVTAANVAALMKRAPESPALARYDEVARILTASSTADAEAGIHWMTALCDTLHIPPLSTYGLTDAMLPDLVEKTLNASSFKGNPVALSRSDITAVLEKAL